MSIQAIARVLDLELNDVSAKAILVGLANHTSPDGQCFPSIRRLMRYSGLSERAVRDTIKRLEELSLVRVDRQPGKRSIYHLQLPTPADAAGVEEGATPANAAGDPGKSRTTTPADAAPHNRQDNRKETSDARELDDDWKPSPSLMARLDYAYPNIDIAEQVKLFILYNQSRGNVVKNPNAAFEVWMRRASSLKLPVKQRPPPARAAAGPFDAAALARGLERVAELKESLGEGDEAAENWIAAAGHWLREQGESGEDVRRCTQRAIKVARKGSWAREQAEAFAERIDGTSKDQADEGQRQADSGTAQ